MGENYKFRKQLFWFRVVFLFIALNLATTLGICEETKASYVIISSLKDALLIAFKNNKDIQIQEQEIEAAKAGILNARSQFLPNVSATAGYTHNAAILNLSSSTTQGLKKDTGVLTGFKNDNKIGVSLNESIYNGGASIVNFKQAQLGLKVQEETLRARKLDIEFETKRLYYGLLLAYETERITKGLVNQAKSHYQDVKNKFKQGRASRFDLLQSKVQISKVMPELVRAKNAVYLIKAELGKLLGLKPQASITVKDRLRYTAIQIKEGEFLKQAYLNKPEMTLKALGVDISKWSINAAGATARPQLNADLGYSYRSNNLGNMFNARHSNWNAGVSVSILLFDGFSTKAKVDEAKARYAQATLEKENLGEQLAVDIRRACLDLQQAEAIIDSQKDNIEEAREALRITEISYDNQEGTNLDILDAQVSLNTIQKNLAEGIYDYLLAKAFLERTMGVGLSGEVRYEKKD